MAVSAGDDADDPKTTEAASSAGGGFAELEEEPPFAAAGAAVLTNLSFKRRKRGKQGPESALNQSEITAISAAIASSEQRPGEPVFFPYVGTKFSSFEEAKNFYNTYSWETGFGIREGRKKTNRNDYVTRKDIICSCEGFCDNPKAASARSGCKAGIHLGRTADHGWIVTAVSSEHNHPLSVSCGEKRQWPSHSFVDPMTKNLIQRLRRNNVPLGCVCSIVGAMGSDSQMQIRKETMKSICAKIAQDDIEDDMKKTLVLLQQMRSEDNDFEVRFRTDDKGVIESMIWCTGRNKRDYEKYGDVLTFDTTYRTNLYNLPFGVFVGVNSHYQSIIFGGVLLRHERTEDFEWTFFNFKDIMGGKQPKTVLTDQCAGMAAAIKTTWKGTRHRWCRWHVLRVAKQKIGPPYSKKSTFKKKFNRLITHEVSASAFEQRWKELVDEYKLSENNFLIRASQMRGMWAKPYFMDIFCVGMTSTQRSESANHMLKRFIQRGAPMHIFVSKFRDLQFERNQAEEKENFKTKMQSRRKRLGLPIEKHAEKIYTCEMHERFYNELYESGGYKIADKSANEKSFVVIHHNEIEKEDPRKYKVYYVSKSKINCSCGLFEHSGLPCRHALKVLVHLDVTEIPTDNIHWRWTKAYSESVEDADTTAISKRVEADGNELKRRMLIMKALELSQSKGNIEDIDYSEALKAMEMVVSKVNENIQKQQPGPNKAMATSIENTSSLCISCPPRTISTGRPRDSTLKSWRKHSKRQKETMQAKEEHKDDGGNLTSIGANMKTRNLSDLLQVT